MTTTDTLPWVEKYRPQDLDHVFGQDEIVNTVRKFVHEGRLPHLLFYGPPGTGKTSTIVALAREIYGKNYKNMVLELNASDDRGIDVVRNQIKEFASTRQIFSQGFKLIILDEADAMTSVAQNSLRRIIEKYTKNTRFCILANYAHKLNPAVLSRCTRFRFNPITTEGIQHQIDDVVRNESLQLTPAANDAVVKLCQGDMRRALNVLQACKAASENGAIDEDMIYECMGSVHPKDIEACLSSVLRDDWTTAVNTVAKYKSAKGIALIDLITGFTQALAQYQLKPQVRMEVLSRLSDIEYAISRGGNDKIQTTAVIASIKQAMEAQA